MDFSNFCNICYNNHNLKDASAEEERFLKELIISIVGNESLIQKNKLFICTICYYKLEGYDKFREMILTNMVQMRQAYYQLKNKLSILKSPDIEKTLQEFLVSRVKYQNVDVFGVCPQVCDLTSEIGDDNSSEDVYVVEPGELYANNSPEEETSDEKLHSEIDLGVQLEEEVTGIVCNTENNAEFDVGSEQDTVPVMQINGNADTEAETTSTDAVMETDYGENNDNGNEENITEDAATVENQINDSTKENICGICDKNLSSRASLLRHAQIHCKNFTCKECGKQFKVRYHFLKHQTTHIQKNAIFDGAMQEIINEVPKHVNISTENELYQCLECENTFSCKTKFKKHQKLHTQQLYSEHLVKSKVSKCTICNKSNITEGNKYCKKCGDSFGQPISCSKCPKIFQLRSDLIFHEQDHNTSKFFSCNICQKKFYKVWALKQHNSIHTGINPFICAICHSGLSSFQSLKKHEHGHKKKVTGKKKKTVKHYKNSF